MSFFGTCILCAVCKVLMCSSEIVLINVFKACFALLAMFGLSDSQQKLLIAQDDHVFGVFYTQSVDVFYRYLK